jgi:hypothetical protein
VPNDGRGDEAEECIGVGRGGTDAVCGRTGTAVVSAGPGGTYLPQVGADGTAASTGVRLADEGVGCLSGPDPVMTSPVIRRAGSTTMAASRLAP